MRGKKTSSWSASVRRARLPYRSIPFGDDVQLCSIDEMIGAEETAARSEGFFVRLHVVLCFACSTRGNILDFVSAMEGVRQAGLFRMREVMMTKMVTHFRASEHAEGRISPPHMSLAILAQW